MVGQCVVTIETVTDSAGTISSYGKTEALPSYLGKKLSDFYTSQGAVLVDAFLAANLAGGTPTARPEDLEINPRNPRKSIKNMVIGWWHWIELFWIGRNVFMVTLVWGTHALPLYWETLNHVGNSNLQTQKRLINTAMKLLKKCRVVVLADREFHSPKLPKWIDDKGIYFALRQKKDLHFQSQT